MKWKFMGLVGILSLGFLIRPSIYAEEKKAEEGPVYKFIQGTEGLPWIPDNYEYIDWASRAKTFNEIIFDTENHDYLFYEPGLYHTEQTKLGIVTLASDEREMSSSEAITLISALLSAQRLDDGFIDDETLSHLAKKVEAYYNMDNGENILLNYQDIQSRDLSFWQQVYPGLLYFMLMDHTEPTENSEELLRQIADSWYDVVMDLGGKTRAVDFAWTGYDFKNKEPYDNGEWVEMDGAAGIGLMQYYAFLRFGERKYMQATMLCMDYLDEFDHHPGHRQLYFYLPYLSARLNAQEGTEYNTAKFIEYFFTETYYQNNWGWFDGLVGNRTEYGGTAYSYESLMAANALVPMLKYDQRYAKEVGRYLLHLTQELDVFFVDNQLIPLNQSQNGEPSILSGTALGLFASMISPTNVDGILRIDLNANEYYDARQEFHQSFLLFNPYPQSEHVQYQVKSDKMVSLYDLVSQDFLALNVQNETQLEIPGEEAVIVLEIEIEEGDNQYKIDRKVEKNVMADIEACVNIESFKRNEKIKTNIPVELDIRTRDVGISTIAIYIDQNQVFKNVTYEEPYIIDVSELSEGYHMLEVEMTASSGYKDYAYARFFVNKEDSEHILAEDVGALAKWDDFLGAISRNLEDDSLEISGAAGSGMMSPVFEMDFSQEPILELEVSNFSAPWSLVLVDEISEEFFTLIESSVSSGTISIDVNEAMKRLNKEKFSLYGPRKVGLAFVLNEDQATLSLEGVRVFNGGIISLSEKEWKTPFTPRKMTQWESRLSGVGKLNYYNGKAYVKNLNDSPSGVGGVKTDYFEVDLTKDSIFKISVEEVDELWSLLVYVEGEHQAHYLQYPTDETGTFHYHVAKTLGEFYDEEDLEGLKNIQFWIVSNGDYEAVTKIDYLSLGYGRSWIQLTLVALIGIMGVSAIFVNINKDM